MTLIGAWQLESFVTEFADGSTLLPYGPRAQGRILYTADGMMAAHLWDPDRHRDGAAQGPDPAYFSYCGEWFVEGDIVRHRVLAATFPDWTGQDQLRTMACDGDRLTLTAQGVVFGGKTGRGVLVWRKAEG